MRKAGLALALVATSQLTLLSSPAFADGAGASLSLSGSADSSGASASASASGSGSGSSDAPSSDDSSSKKSTGWILVGVGGAVTVGGIVVDIVGANSGTIAGAGNDSGNTDNTRTDLLFFGTTLIVAGLVTGIYGGSMVWNADHHTADKATPPPADDAKVDGVTKAAQAQLASAPTFTLPIVGARF